MARHFVVNNNCSSNRANAVTSAIAILKIFIFRDGIMFKNAYCEVEVQVGISLWLMLSPIGLPLELL